MIKTKTKQKNNNQKIKLSPQKINPKFNIINFKKAK